MREDSRFAGSGPRLLLFTLLGFFLSALALSGLIGVLSRAGDLSLTDAGFAFDTVAERQSLRLLLLINNLLTFTATGLAGLLLTYGGDWSAAAGLRRPARPRMVLYAVAVFVAGLPLIGLVAYLNLQLDLPGWMNASEDQANRMLRGVLTFATVPELLLALVTAALVPAIGEELVFRGILQRRVLGDLVNDHLAVWLAAAVFSAIHFEFAGFLPRFLLGALLGYGYRWTRSLWVPIAVHFAFNGVQVINTYVTGEYVPDTQMDTAFAPLLAAGIVSLVVTVFVVRRAEDRAATV